MLNLSRQLFSLFIFVCLSFYAHSQQVIFFTEDLPPLQIANDEQHNTSGALVELMELVIKESQINGKIQFYPWARSYGLSLEQPNTFIFSMLRSEEREQKFIWIDKLYTIRSYFAALKTRKDIAINSIDDAKQYSVGSIRHDLAEDYLLQKGFTLNKNLYLSSKYSILWEALYSGRVDIAFTNSVIWKHEIIKTGLDASMLSLIFDIPDFASDMYLAANLHTDPELIKKVKNSLTSIKADGRYDKLLEKWHLK